MQKRVVSQLFLALLVLFPAVLCAAENSVQYELSVAISPHDSSLRGVASITSRAAASQSFDVEHLRVHSVKVDGKQLPEQVFKGKKQLRIKNSRRIIIRFSARYDDSYDHGIFPGNIVLTDHWFPVVTTMARYRLNIDLPSGYQAATSADDLHVATRRDRTIFHFDFPHPQPGLEGLALVASDSFTIREQKAGEVMIQVMLRKGMEQYAESLLLETQTKINEYARMFGPYPYRRLAVVDAPVTNSLSYPGLLVMARKNIRNLPNDATLAHELVHEWFGNTVFIDWKNGNWAEGAAIYFADHAFMENQGEGWRCRQRILQGYRTWVLGRKEIPLSRFEGREDRLTRWIGYGKGALVYHMLRKELGDERFFAGIRHFMSLHRGKPASWGDLQNIFEQESGKTLDWFFTLWVHDVGLPTITARVEAEQRSDGHTALTLHLQSDKKTHFNVPVLLRAPEIDLRKTVRLEGTEAKLNLDEVKSIRQVVIDPDYDLLRNLQEDEYGPSIERLEAEENLLIIPSQEDTSRYQPLIDLLQQKKPLVKLAGFPSDIARQGHLKEELRINRSRKGTRTMSTRTGYRMRSMQKFTDQQLAARSLVILGNDNPLLRRLFKGELPQLLARPAHGVSLNVLKHPMTPDRLVAVIDSSSAKETSVALETLENYGGNGAVALSGGELVEKRLGNAGRGMSIIPSSDTTAASVPVYGRHNRMINGNQ